MIGGVEQEDPLLRAGPSPQRRMLCEGVPGGDHGSLLRRPRIRLLVSGRSTRGASCTTTPAWRWPRSWETAGESTLGSSQRWCPTTCSRIGSAVQARGTTRARWRGLVGYARRNFLVPIPSYGSFDELNAHLREKCLETDGEEAQGGTRRR